MTIIKGLLYLYFLLKPFYIFSSGTLQISDAFIVIAFFLSAILWKNNKELYDARISKKLLPLVVFIICVGAINIINYLIYSDSRFLLATAQYIFILMGIITFSTVIGDKKFISNYIKIININIIIQFIIYVLGLGKYYGETRYMGTFNDPNQFGFFLIISLSMLYLFENYLKKQRRNIVIYILVIFLLFTTVSTGMMLALVTFIVAIIFIKNRQKKKVIITKNKIAIIVIIVLLVGSSLLYLINNKDSKVLDLVSSMAVRVTEKINKVDNDEAGVIEERGLDRLLKYPQYMILGAGEGAFYRFPESYHMDEIHSTLPSILFYYGIIPFLILVYWIYNNTKTLNRYNIIPYLAIFIESFTLLNQRQLLLWVLIIFANVLNFSDSEECEKKYETR